MGWMTTATWVRISSSLSLLCDFYYLQFSKSFWMEWGKSLMNYAHKNLSTCAGRNVCLTHQHKRWNRRNIFYHRHTQQNGVVLCDPFQNQDTYMCQMCAKFWSIFSQEVFCNGTKFEQFLNVKVSRIFLQWTLSFNGECCIGQCVYGTVLYCIVIWYVMCIGCWC